MKGLTDKPVVGVGRYTSPDRMVSLVSKGVLDMIGAARPSISDPFLPRKIEEGRPEDIRECIGCNICVGYSNNSVPIRCTQNPTMGEEWRRGWHPERIEPKDRDRRILVVGAGPAGLEAARALGQRGYEVLLAEATTELGGRVARESRLPGLATWGRVRDYRLQQLGEMANVEVFRESAMTAASVLDTDCALVAVATGAIWRGDGVGRAHRSPIVGLDNLPTFTPDDVMDGAEIPSPVVVYDDDHYYMGGVIAELLCSRGLDTTLVTPAAVVSSWTEFTLEQTRIQKGLLKMGVKIMASAELTALDAGGVETTDVYSGQAQHVEAAAAIVVTALSPVDALYHSLLERQDAWADHGVERVTRIGDCYGPGTIAAAVWSGHKYARTLGASEGDEVAFKREIVALSDLG